MKGLDKATIERSIEVLQNSFGHTDYKDGQRDIVEAALQGRDVLATLSTGSGKSLCYQMPAVMDESGKTTVVVSPLIALMRDQVNALQRKGVAAIDIHSGRAESDRELIMRGVREGAFKIVYTSPEQLKNKSFQNAAKEASIARVAVDEAHCIVEWGRDFRPEYREIRDFVVANKVRQILAFTATASADAKKEIRDSLKLRDPFEYHGDLVRPNLSYDVAKIIDPRKRKKIIADYIQMMAPNSDDAVIIYCATRDEVETVAASLEKQKLPVSFYHAGLDSEEREQREEDFLTDKKRILVATNAFGMGVDKANIRLIIHNSMPGSIQAYLQETGRAGRDGKPASCVLLYNEKDRNIHDHFILEKTPGVEFMQNVYDAIARQKARSKQVVRDPKAKKEWFPLNLIGLYQSFTTGTGFEKRQRDTQVNAAIDAMVQQGILIKQATYYHLNPFPVSSDAQVESQRHADHKKMIAQASLEQVIKYATAEKPDQKMLVDLLNQSLL